MIHGLLVTSFQMPYQKEMDAQHRSEQAGGTENGIMATVQCFIRRNDTDSQSGINAHRYGSSHSNLIEAWWAYLQQSWSSWWIDCFKDMVDGGSLDLSDKLHSLVLLQQT